MNTTTSPFATHTVITSVAMIRSSSILNTSLRVSVGRLYASMVE